MFCNFSLQLTMETGFFSALGPETEEQIIIKLAKIKICFDV